MSVVGNSFVWMSHKAIVLKGSKLQDLVISKPLRQGNDKLHQARSQRFEIEPLTQTTIAMHLLGS